MRHIDFDKKFTLLAQEAFLTKNTILLGFDLLLKSNFFQDKDGYFYSSFFNISIGMERIFKISIITHHMLTNNYSAPSIKKLKKEFGHDLRVLYLKCLELMPEYEVDRPTEPFPKEDSDLIDFFTNYAKNSRYFNLNEVCEKSMDRSPLDEWVQIAQSIYDQHTPFHVRNRCAMRLLYKTKFNGITYTLDESGQLMTFFDCIYRQYLIEKSSPLVIWRLIEILRPILFLLESMAKNAAKYENRNNIKKMVIPHYEEFFYFLREDRKSIIRRKSWLKTFNG